MAQHEDGEWEYKYIQSDQSYPILRNYIFYTFDRIFEEQKITETTSPDGGVFACFNTGLFTPLWEQIYALFVENKKKSINNILYRPNPIWFLSAFVKESDSRMRKFKSTPSTADYFQEPTDLIYDRRIKLICDKEHILRENRDRFKDCLTTVKDEDTKKDLNSF